MNVAVLTTPQARFTEYWQAYLAALGVEVARPLAPFGVWLEAGQGSLPEEPLGVQLALGEILSLGRQVDAVLVPQQPAVRSDAWAEALAELLPQRIAGLPTLLPVPDDAALLPAAAAAVGQRLVGNAGVVHRALEQVQPLLQPRREEWPRLALGSRVTVGVVGPRSLLAHPALRAGLDAALAQAGLHPVYAQDLPDTQVADRGRRLDDSRATPGERALFGAARLLEGKGAVTGLVLPAPARDAAMAAALDRLAAGLHKPVLRLTVDAGSAAWPELTAWAAHLGADPAAR